MKDFFDDLANRALQLEPLTRSEAMEVLNSSDDDLLDLIAAAGRVRRKYFGRRVKLNALVNMKSGLCPEDCGYCSQRKGSEAEILKYKWIDPEEAVTVAKGAIASGAKRVCLVASGRGPTDRDIDKVASTIDAIKEAAPAVEICACLGLLKEGQAERLREAGTFAYNHNLNTSESQYEEICSTHTYDDRVDTVEQAKSAGLSPCSGAIFGMGETKDDIIDVAFALRELNPDSVPVNFLMPFDGTPMAGRWDLTPALCLRILALFRLVFPDTEVRLAGGREVNLRSMQPLALHLVNSIFLGDYLTSEGQPGHQDLRMIADAGFVVESMDGTESQPTTGEHDEVAIRRRGVGTDLPANV